MKKFYTLPAFTLAEVLITLGIIGVVAAMTIPTLVNNYQKQVVVTKLQKAYAVMSQAIKLSEIENGSIDNWTWPSANDDGNLTMTWFNTYLAPCMKYTKAELTQDAGSIQVYLSDGTIINFWYFNEMHVSIFLDGNKNPVGSKNKFWFFIGKGSVATKADGIRPYDSEITNTPDRNTWKDHSKYGCNKDATNADKPYCAGLIMYDGWQIKDDYPFFN